MIWEIVNCLSILVVLNCDVFSMPIRIDNVFGMGYKICTGCDLYGLYYGTLVHFISEHRLEHFNALHFGA